MIFAWLLEPRDIYRYSLQNNKYRERSEQISPRAKQGANIYQYLMIIGHKTQWDFLKRLSQNNKIPHAFLFIGEDALGKRKVAIEFIKFLNCSSRDIKDKPCQKCPACNLIDKGRHPDLIIVKPQKKQIQIFQIRDLQKSLSLKPQLADFKSVIIEEAESLNKTAQNCLLKTLEEPKGKTLFFLVSSKPQMLFETIRSRCAVLKFYPLDFNEMEKYFSSEFSNPQFKETLLLSEGKPGKAIDLLRIPQKFSETQETFKQIQKILKATLPQRFIFAKDFLDKEKSAESLKIFLENFEKYLRMLILKKLAVKNESFYSPFLPSEIDSDYPILKLKEMINSVEKLRILISQTNVNPRLAFETLMLII